MDIISKTINFYRNNGFILFLFRFPYRILNVSTRKIYSSIWKLILKDVGKGFVIEIGSTFQYPRQASIGDNVYIGKKVRFGSELESSHIKIGDRVSFVQECAIDHTGGLIIEDDILFSEKVTVFTHSHGSDPHSEPKPTPLTIKKKCWIGYRATIMEGVTQINDSNIIAAGAVVTKQCREKNYIYAGVPAKPIKPKNIT